jgi:protein-tyrosine phosphatase
MVRAADLVLCAERDHRAEVVTLVPAATRRAFTLREFGRLLTGINTAELSGAGVAERADAMLNLAARRRGTVPVTDAADDDIPDPYRGPYKAFTDTAQMIADSLRGPIDILADVPAAWSD